MKAYRDHYGNLCRFNVLGVIDILRDDSMRIKANDAKQEWLVWNWFDVEKQLYFTAKQQIRQFGKIK